MLTGSRRNLYRQNLAPRSTMRQVGAGEDRERFRRRALEGKARRAVERDELARLDATEVAHHYVTGDQEPDELERNVEHALGRRERFDEQLRRELELGAVREREWERTRRPLVRRSRLIIAGLVA